MPGRNCISHQSPPRPMSCSLRTLTDNMGRKLNIPNSNKLAKPTIPPPKIPIASLSPIIRYPANENSASTSSENNHVASTNHQYSERVALPENVAYLP